MDGRGLRVAVISDIHGNLEALESVIAALPAVDRLWCLGDIVGYGSQPSECLSLLTGLPLPLVSVAGNHDLAAAGVLSLATFNPEGREAILWTRPRLTVSDLGDLGRETRLPAPDAPATLLHASPRDPVWEYITSAETAETCFSFFDTPMCLFGHTHRPVIYSKRNGSSACRFMPAAEATVPLLDLGDRWLVNPGSVGQPRDGDPRASFLLLDLKEMSATWRRVDYPFDAAAAKIREAGLPPVLADRLAFGI